MTELAGQKYFDLYFLDVEMENQVNGIELSYRIHDCYLEPVIVYVTNAPEAFGVNAFRFIPVGSVFIIGGREYTLNAGKKLDIPYGADIYDIKYPLKEKK